MLKLTYFHEISLFFTAIISISLYLDFCGHKSLTNISIKNSIAWSIFWLLIALLFYGFLYLEFNKEWANLYLVGYLLEKTLSLDNLMIFIAIFSTFGVSPLLERKILFWGIFGAIIFRGLLVIIGTKLYQASHWLELIFAIFILWTAIKMLTKKNNASLNNKVDITNHWSIRYLSKIFPIYPQFYQDKFFITYQEILANNLTKHISTIRKIYITPAFLCLIIIESSDLAFAFDSVPAIIAITHEPILVYAAIIFAILGLRSLYFTLAILIKSLIYLETTVIILLLFIVVKILLQFYNNTIMDTGYNISPNQSLIIVLTILTIGIIASLLTKKKLPKP